MRTLFALCLERSCEFCKRIAGLRGEQRAQERSSCARCDRFSNERAFSQRRDDEDGDALRCQEGDQPERAVGRKPAVDERDLGPRLLRAHSGLVRIDRLGDDLVLQAARYAA